MGGTGRPEMTWPSGTPIRDCRHRRGLRLASLRRGGGMPPPLHWQKAIHLAYILVIFCIQH
jgi:hypothetical protein